MDDLSFEEDESDYKFLKAVIEGGVETISLFMRRQTEDILFARPGETGTMLSRMPTFITRIQWKRSCRLQTDSV